MPIILSSIYSVITLFYISKLAYGNHERYMYSEIIVLDEGNIKVSDYFLMPTEQFVSCLIH